ncbi:NAD-dependent protein deacylase [Clostridium beijerinckii]|uniref:NAD-dependent protein deacetylase n=1 Tax=Clostridium beijerinckii TaxID=1520 RepID=A0AAW3W6V0_CLOBE|nr:NAD-dependent protein deacylase [Clostridium beijerinckii]MBC2457592.1 NAD-dependent protein deacylase [Clostridium beijerinckii]MBC2474583.1 NAD-dependent protein deacylase [Clostridium beijerinckii]NOV62460.1 NAD-dependent deacetylase [Clostridium beijerinckii]NOV68043.1 NAD-dependent deacetylase [Clostridium beijerinckii]NOW30512.1 NAD-dependent deacetylase [Clostridium beijerinckii]
MSIEKLSEILKNSNNIVFFGGAGISTESNIPDFRSSNGLFSEKLNATLTPEQLVSHTFYIKYPEELFKFYKAKLIYPEAKPNAGHLALAKLEEMGKLKAIVTQNIDGLHQMAGSKNVFELHGSIHRNYCVKCHESYDVNFILQSKEVPTCTKCGGTVKPDVVLYEEGLDDKVIRESINAISNADTLIIGGTSLVVYPAAGLINYFRGKNLVLINKSSTSADSKANLVINDSFGKTLSEAIKEL